MRFLLPRFESLPLWPVIAAPVFLGLFLLIVCWTYRKDRKQLYQKIENLPLEDTLESKIEELR
jgi:cbb3-type cytochrome oxidase subunit 3